MNDGELWETDDTSLASFLTYHEHEILSFEWDTLKCSFVFRWSPDLDRLIDEFDEGQARVEPEKYTMVSARVRKAMFEARDGNRGRSGRRRTATR